MGASPRADAADEGGAREGATAASTEGKALRSKLRFEGIDLFEVNEGGKIQPVRAYWNPAEMIAQL